MYWFDGDKNFGIKANSNSLIAKKNEYWNWIIEYTEITQKIIKFQTTELEGCSTADNILYTEDKGYIFI